MINPIFKGDKKIGHIQNNIYYSHRTREHIFRKFGNGFGLSVKLIDFLEEKKVDKVIIVFENKHEFECPLDYFYIKGFTYKDGDDEQLILPNKLFSQKIVTEVQTAL